MANLFLNSSQQGIVVFKLYQSLEYKKRVIISFLLILTGILSQFFGDELFPGVIFLLAGTAFVLPSGYDNRVKAGRYNAGASWEKTDEKGIKEFLAHIKKVKKWDLSSLDVTSGLGILTLIVVIAGLVGAFLYGTMYHRYRFLEMVAIDGAVLIIPFWLTGLRLSGVSEVMGSAIMIYVRKIKILLRLALSEETKKLRGNHTLDYYVLLKDDHTKVPIDAKFRINIQDKHDDFMGLYGQIVTNTVQNESHMYFYMVLVARMGYGSGSRPTGVTPGRG